MASDEILIIELKERWEPPLNIGQQRALRALALKDGITVWIVRRLGRRRALLCRGPGRANENVSEEYIADLVAAWWQWSEGKRDVAR